MSSGSLNVLRKGVIASVKTKNRRVQSPVVCCSVSTGLIPKSPRNNPQLNKTNGIDETRNTAPFVHLLVISFRKIRRRLSGTSSGPCRYTARQPDRHSH